MSAEAFGKILFGEILPIVFGLWIISWIVKKIKNCRIVKKIRERREAKKKDKKQRTLLDNKYFSLHYGD